MPFEAKREVEWILKTPGKDGKETSFLNVQKQNSSLDVQKQNESGPAAITVADDPNTFLCIRAVDVFDPSNPQNVMGQFDKGTKLKVENGTPKNGKNLVSCIQRDGTLIFALCRSLDLGR